MPNIYLPKFMDVLVKDVRPGGVEGRPKTGAVKNTTRDQDVHCLHRRDGMRKNTGLWKIWFGDH
jgi:hypothetical protein